MPNYEEGYLSHFAKGVRRRIQFTNTIYSRRVVYACMRQHHQITVSIREIYYAQCEGATATIVLVFP